MPHSRTVGWVVAWLLLSTAAAASLGWVLLDDEPSTARAWFTPGPMTHGHHQIELACAACHTSAFGGEAVLQNACVDCHGAQLERADDSHPKSKFTDPRNAELVARLDARKCVACHVEHRPGITETMGVSLPADYCVTCHRDVAEERPTHQGLGFETCATVGCHNFHDNRALYEDFLLKHAHQPMLLDSPLLAERDFGARWRAEHTETAHAAHQPDHAGDATIVGDWLETAHAQAGVQCSGCHAQNGAAWRDRPDHDSCRSCHTPQVEGFLSGKHGMRLDAGLPPMTPAQARLPMHADAAHRELSCTSCHGAHRFDTQQAAVEACLGCHADEHSLAFKKSKHFALLQRERSGELPSGSGVSCASCHMPRVISDLGGGESRVDVEHNQNDTLQPVEAMIRPACLHCHSLGFSIDALADPQLRRNNFQGHPAGHVESVDMALRNLEADRVRRRTPPAE